MKPDELRALADEIERDELPSPEFASRLDERFAVALWGGWKHRSNVPQPSPVTNLQDAVDAVPEGLSWGRDDTGAMWVHRLESDWKFMGLGECQNPAAALCAAILRAKAAEMEGA